MIQSLFSQTILVSMVSHIIHLSDIHLRNGLDRNEIRYDTYIQVIDNLTRTITDNNYPHPVFVITGDIFHNKSKAHALTLDLFKYLIKNLTSFGEVILIEGNHDIRFDQPTDPSLVDPFTGYHNVHLLKTGTVVIGRIGFTSVNVLDTIKKDGTYDIVPSDQLPSFPKNFNRDIDKMIALFHGSFRGVNMTRDVRVPDEPRYYPLDWIVGFDYVMLGDIHLQQKFVYKETPVAYAGSLIQQNYGEQIIKHGYGCLDLSDMKYTFVKIYNPNGFLNLSNIDGVWSVGMNGNKDYKPLEDIITQTLFPKEPYIRLHNNTNDIHTLINLLNENNVIVNVEKLITEHPQTNNTHNTNHISNFVSINDHLAFRDIDILKKHFKDDQKALDLINDMNKFSIKKIDNIPSLNNLIHTQNKLIDKELSSLNNTIEKSYNNGNTFKLLHLKWSWILCFGDNNNYDFEKALGNVAIVNGKNGTGKTAFFDVICIALFGDPIPSRHKQKAGQDHYIVNTNKPTSTSCNTQLIFIVHDKKYLLNRNLQHCKTKDVVSIRQKVSLTDITNPDEHTKIATGMKELDVWLSNNIGSLNDFIEQSMITQNLDKNILDMSSKDTKAHIENIININTIKNMIELCNRSSLGHKQVNDNVLSIKSDRYIKRDELLKLNNSSSDAYTELLKTHKDELASMKKKVSDISIDHNKYPKKELERSKNDLYSICYNLKSSLDLHDYVDMESVTKQKNVSEHNLMDTRSLTIADINKYAKSFNPDIPSMEQIDKPSFDIKYINDLKKSIKGFKEPKVIPDMKLTECQEQLEKLQKMYSDHLEEKPNIVYDRNYGKNPEAALNKIKYEFGSYEECHRLSMLYKGDQWTHNGYKYDINAGNDHKKDTSKIKEDRILEYEKIVENFEKYIQEKKQSIDDQQQDINQYTQKLLQLDVVSKPSISYDEANSFLDELDKNQKYYDKNTDKYQQIQDVFEEYDAIEKVIVRLKDDIDRFKNIEYNPNCEVCMKQDHVVQLNKWKVELVDNQNKQKEVKGKLGKRNMDNLRVKLQEFVLFKNDFDVMITKKDEYNKIIETWSKYNDFKLQYDLNKANIDSSTESMNVSKNELTDLVSQSNDHKKYLNSMKGCIKDAYDQIASLKIIQNNSVLFDFEEKAANIKKDTQSIKNNLDLAKQYDKWINEIQPVIHDIKDKEEQLKRWKVWDEWLITKDCYDYKNICDKLNNLTDLRMYQEIVDTVYDQYQEKKTLDLSIEKIESEILDLEKKIYDTEKNKQNLIDLEKEIEAINETEKYLTDHIGFLDYLKDEIKEIKDKVYQQNILPAICNNVNRIVLEAVSDHLKYLKLIAEIQGDNIKWYVSNLNGDKIPINKASGFQRFIIGLALRLSIPYLTSASHKCRQLFIDEGFVNSDNDNLSKVPQFLQRLLLRYEGVLLVSHLDIIKEACDVTINIRRENVEYNDNKFAVSKIDY
tara:strand:+ start:576 stop:4949 length:4374 start_codon:yes stop_codon:yes gene_type:complete